jgi:hypothetical protein
MTDEWQDILDTVDNPPNPPSPGRLPVDRQPVELGGPFDEERPTAPGYVRLDFRPRSRSPEPSSSVLSGNIRLPLLIFTDEEADTSVYIDPAPRHSRPDQILPPEAQPVPHRVHSRALLQTGSSVFKKYFEPRYQTRLRKRRGFAGNLPDGIKYVIDLTPATEGDDALIFMTELSCPLGVRKWARQQTKWRLPHSCVAGQDEIEWIPGPPPAPEPKVVSDSPKTKRTENCDGCNKGNKNKKCRKHRKVGWNPPRLNWDGDLPQLPKQEVIDDGHSTMREEPEKRPTSLQKVPGLPLDYSPIRHRTCIERVLHALEGLDPRLDTAPKLWTFFALAKLFDVATVPDICDYILAWLFQQSNSLFVELHPELAYQISCGIRNSGLCRESFAILVGEEALQLVQTSARRATPKRSPKTFHGRPRETLDDAELQRIEYASKTFVDRILETFVALVGTEMSWVEPLVLQHVVDRRVEMDHMDLIRQLTRDLKEYIRGYVYAVLQHQQSTRTLERERIGSVDDGEPEYPGIDFLYAPGSMFLVSRIMTRTFWRALMTEKFPDFMLTSYSSPTRDSIRDLASHLPCFKSQGDARIRYAPQAAVINAVHRFDSKIDFLRSGSGSNDKKTDLRTISSTSYFDLSEFQKDVQDYLVTFAKKMVEPPPPAEATIGMVQFQLVDTLLCLGEEEFKFLPLWAGGNDDGTGGVFVLDQDVPMLETGGFSRPGPAVHTGTGSSMADSASTVDSFSTIHPSDAASTMQRASHQATASHQTETDVVSLGTISSAATDDRLWHRVNDLDLNEDSRLDEMDEEEDGDIDADDNASNPSIMSSGTIGPDSQNQLDLDDDDDDDYEHLDLEEASDTNTNTNTNSIPNSNTDSHIWSHTN